jgi:hypothetical protein
MKFGDLILKPRSIEEQLNNVLTGLSPTGTYFIQGESTNEDAGSEGDREEERGQGREDAQDGSGPRDSEGGGELRNVLQRRMSASAIR